MGDITNLQTLQENREEQLKQFFESCLDNLGDVNVNCVQIWIRYIDFETMRNNLALVNLLCYMALEQPMEGN